MQGVSQPALAVSGGVNRRIAPRSKKVDAASFCFRDRVVISFASPTRECSSAVPSIDSSIYFGFGGGLGLGTPVVS